jgi:cyclopropane fatty-acyl-phospholipid synthase-like methyltransferase
MAPGQLARKLLGPAFPIVGGAYRRFFVDMERVADWITVELGDAQRILDIGGGDGFFASLLLDRMPDLEVTLTDLSASVGTFIPDRNRARIKCLPSTDHCAVDGAFDALILTDVIHHVPSRERRAFLESVADTARRVGARSILVKDIEPEGVRARLAVWTDHHITGDKNVEPAPMRTLEFPGFRRLSDAMIDHPNYCAHFTHAEATLLRSRT